MEKVLFSIHDLALILALIVCITVGSVSLFGSHKRNLSSVLLAAFFYCVAVCMFCKIVFFTEGLQEFEQRFNIALTFAYITACLSKGPALFLYFCSISQSPYKLGRATYPLLISSPVIGVIAIFMGARAEYFSLEIWETTPVIFISVAFLGISPLVFAIMSVFCLKKARRLLRNYYSGPIDNTAMWLNLLVYFYIVCWTWGLFCHFFGGLLGLMVYDRLPFIFGVINNYLSLISSALLFFYSVSLAFNRLSKALDMEQDKSESRLTDFQNVLDCAIAAMEKRELYLESSLNIERFSKKIGFRTKDVSHAINLHLNCNFFEFVNGYRLNEAKRLLLQDKDKSVNDIMLASGFNSTSSFYRIFKHATGVSPNYYRSNYSNLEGAVINASAS